MSKMIIRISMLLVLTLSIWACGGTDKSAAAQDNAAQTEAQASGSEPTAEGQEFNAKYQCPMHCPGSGSETYGSCPKCGMRYMYNPNLPDAVEINKKLFRENPQIDPEKPQPAGGHEGHGH